MGKRAVGKSIRALIPLPSTVKVDSSANGSLAVGLLQLSYPRSVRGRESSILSLSVFGLFDSLCLVRWCLYGWDDVALNG